MCVGLPVRFIGCLLSCVHIKISRYLPRCAEKTSARCVGNTPDLSPTTMARHAMGNTHRRVRKIMRAETIRDPLTALADALRSATAGLAAPSKVIARDLKADPAAVRNWMNARNGPKFGHLVELAREYDEVWAILRELAGRETIGLDDLTEEERRVVLALRAVGKSDGGTALVDPHAHMAAAPDEKGR